MKHQFTIVLAALSVWAGVADAQTTTKDAPPELKQGLAPSEYERELPPLPKLDPKSRARTEIRILKTSRGEIFQVEAVQQSIGDILRAVTTMMGSRAIIDPKLDELRLSMVAFRASNWEKLLDNIAVAERWKSASGTYFFAALPGVTGVETRDEKDAEARQNRLKAELLRQYSPNDVFVFPSIDLNLTRRSPVPQPGWEKREFNGRDVYFIPVPGSTSNSTKADEKDK